MKVSLKSTEEYVMDKRQALLFIIKTVFGVGGDAWAYIKTDRPEQMSKDLHEMIGDPSYKLTHFDRVMPERYHISQVDGQEGFCIGAGDTAFSYDFEFELDKYED